MTGVLLVEDGAIVSPGNQAEIGFAPSRPAGIEPGIRFAIREGGKTVGAGLVTVTDQRVGRLP